MNKLYFGDNLDVLRECVADESVDLIYLDPPFNSQAQYNVLFQNPKDDAGAQVEAFRDTWSWGEESAWAYAEMMRAGGEAARLIDALRGALGDSNMMAYLVMMAVRLKEMRRVLKPTGALYLHCDPTASHYLKVILDAIYGRPSFLNEIIWKRTTTKNDFQQGAKNWPRVHDVILYYARDPERLSVFHQPFAAHDEAYIAQKYNKVDANGRRYMLDNLTAPGAGSRGHPQYELMGVTRYWRYGREKMLQLVEEGRVVQPSLGAVPRYVRYLDEMKGVAIGDVWTDIDAVNSQARERRGYPTQKPLSLLDRIIRASSNEGDTVLDPFCGCGTTVEAAQRAGREWIGIDVAVHAIKVIESRLAERLGAGVKYDIEGMPRDFESAVKLAERDKYQFQWWANYLFNPHALREQKKGADRGIDGELFFPNGPGRPWGRMLTSVKGGHTGPNDVRAFARVLEREGAQLGLFICLRSPTREMVREAASVGLADVVHGDIFKLQIVSIEDWFKGKRPLLPPLEHLPSAAFAGRPRRSATPRPDPQQRLLPLSIPGVPATPDGVVRHLNPGMVREIA